MTVLTEFSTENRNIRKKMLLEKLKKKHNYAKYLTVHTDGIALEQHLHV